MNRQEYQKKWKSENKERLSLWAFDNNRKYKGFTSRIYNTQKANSRKYKRKPPEYSLIELRDWLLNKTNFSELFEVWQKSNYKKDLKPTIDRIDPIKHYSFKNIQVITHKENAKKAYWNDAQIHAQKRSRSGVVGVYKCHDRDWWQAKIGKKPIGRFKKFEDAVKARRKAFNELQLATT